MNADLLPPDSSPVDSAETVSDDLGLGRKRRSRWVIGICGLLLLIATVAGGWQLYRQSVIRSVPSQIAAAEFSLRSGKFAAAKNHASTILQFIPNDPEALSILGRCLREERKFDAAILMLERIPEDSPAYEKSGFALASTYLQMGNLEQAELVLRRILERFPNSDPARDELRWLCFNQFRPRDVIKILEEKLSLKPGDPKTLADLLDSEYRQQVPFEGAKYLEQIHQQRPGQGSVTLALGFALWRIGEADRARTLFQQALSSRPDDPLSRFTVAAFLIERGQLAEADQVLNRHPIPDTDDRYWALSSQISEQRHDAATALSQIDSAISLHGNDPHYASQRTNLLRKLGRKRDAELASTLAYELQKVDRLLADVVEAQTHHHPTPSDASRIAGLYEQAGRTLVAKHWRILAERLTEGRSSP